jgi:hypothetical protein
VNFWLFLVDFGTFWSVILAYQGSESCETVRAPRLEKVVRIACMVSAYADRQNNLQKQGNFLTFVLSGLGGDCRVGALTHFWGEPGG